MKAINEVQRIILINRNYLINYLKENNIKLRLNDDQLDRALSYINENVDYAVHDCVMTAINVVIGNN
jgi:hypothetical protein